MQKDIEKLLQKYKNETYFISVSSNINIDGYTNFVFLNREEGLFTPNTLTRTCHSLRESCNKEEIEAAQENQFSFLILLSMFLDIHFVLEWQKMGWMLKYYRKLWDIVI